MKLQQKKNNYKNEKKIFLIKKKAYGKKSLKESTKKNS